MDSNKLTKTQGTVLNGIVWHILTALGGGLVARGSPAGVIWSAIAKGYFADT